MVLSIPELLREFDSINWLLFGSSLFRFIKLLTNPYASHVPKCFTVSFCAPCAGWTKKLKTIAVLVGGAKVNKYAQSASLAERPIIKQSNLCQYSR